MPVVLAALPELLVGLVLILLIWAARALFGGMLSSLASRVPLLGSVIATAVDGVTNDVVAAARALAQEGIQSAYGLILGPVFWLEHMLTDVWDAFDAVRQVLAYITGSLLQLAVNLAVTEARALVAAAVRQLENLVNQIYSIVQGEVARIYATIDQVESALTSYIQAEAAALTREIEAGLAAETAFIGQVENALTSEISAAITAETAFVEREFAAAVSYTEAAVIGLDGVIEADTTAITAWVTEQLISLAGAIDLVQTATVALTLGAVKAVETDLGNLKADCTDNLCSGTGALASLLNELAQAGWIGMLLAYAAWGASDPEDCGHATANVLGPLASGAVDLVKSAAAAV